LRTETKAQLPETTDLRGITRRPDRCRTTVRFVDRYETIETIAVSQPDRRPAVFKPVDWLVVGEAQLHRPADHSAAWTLKAYLADGATDNEHDSAYALQLPLIGVELRNVFYQVTMIRAWVQPQDYDDANDAFRVPRPGYDPRWHPSTRICRECEMHHPVVLDEFYLPPHDPQLFRLVAGRRVEIAMGPAATDEED